MIRINERTLVADNVGGPRSDGQPTNPHMDGSFYSVIRKNGIYCVERQEWRNCKRLSTSIVASFPTEQQADMLAAHLAITDRDIDDK